MMLQKTGHELDHNSACQMYAGRVNKPWVKFLNLLDMNVNDTRCVGSKLYTDTGDCYTDFLSGCGVRRGS